MKRNGLLLSAGIIYILSFLGCVLSGALTMVSANTLGLVLYEFDQSLQTIYMLYIIVQYIFACAGMLVGICELVFGILLIVFYAKNKPLQSFKGMLIASIVIGYTGAFISLSLDSGIVVDFVLLLVASILISVALGNNRKSRLDPSVSYGGVVGFQSGEPVTPNETADTDVDGLAKKLKLVGDLKNSGAIEEDEYLKIVKNLLGIPVKESVSEPKSDTNQNNTLQKNLSSKGATKSKTTTSRNAAGTTNRKTTSRANSRTTSKTNLSAKTNSESSDNGSKKKETKANTKDTRSEK